ncbi:MAG: hypothetical protein LBD46_00030 [Endomicrobium sp.]|jgi:hypothetical protein|nr:hypothetical protein [Endomicrobium sp.]
MEQTENPKNKIEKTLIKYLNERVGISFGTRAGERVPVSVLVINFKAKYKMLLQKSGIQHWKTAKYKKYT